MQSEVSFDVPVVLEHPDDRRVYCTSCHHSEFVHGDIAERRCLYSECRCGSFSLGSAE